MTIGPPIPEIQFDLQNSRSKVKVKGQGQRYPSQRSIQLTHFPFASHQLDQPFLRYGNRMFNWGEWIWYFMEKIAKKTFLTELLQNLIRRLAWQVKYTYQVFWRLDKWFEETSFSGFPGKLKSVGRNAAAAEMAAAETDKKTISSQVTQGDLISNNGK